MVFLKLRQQHHHVLPKEHIWQVQKLAILQKVITKFCNIHIKPELNNSWEEWIFVTINFIFFRGSAYISYDLRLPTVCPTLHTTLEIWWQGILLPLLTDFQDVYSMF